MSEAVSPVLNQTTKSGVRLLLKWRNGIINFGTIDFKQDGTLIYSSAFHADQDKYPAIITGTWNEKLGDKPQYTTPNDTGGIHASLHPNKDGTRTIGQVMHIRHGNHGSILASKKMQWFPVEKEFLFLRVLSPPLNECTLSQKLKDFAIEIPDNYIDSIEVWIRVMPWAENFVFAPQPDPNLLNWVIGFHRRHYYVVCGFFLTQTRSAPAVLYPIDN
jgi:hypothetical protein